MANVKSFLKNYYFKLFKPSGWVNGSYGGYDFEAKVYNQPSAHGIDGGRISKLVIKRYGRVIADYNRGWVVEPKGLYKDAFEMIKSIIS